MSRGREAEEAAEPYAPPRPSPEEEWARLSPSERTCLESAFSRLLAARECQQLDGSPLLLDPLGPLVVESCIPAATRAELAAMKLQGLYTRIVGVRTAELDRCAALVAEHRLGQVVLLGAGMDTRAWRLQVRGGYDWAALAGP